MLGGAEALHRDVRLEVASLLNRVVNHTHAFLMPSTRLLRLLLRVEIDPGLAVLLHFLLLNHLHFLQRYLPFSRLVIRIEIREIRFVEEAFLYIFGCWLLLLNRFSVGLLHVRSNQFGLDSTTLHNNLILLNRR